MSENKNGVTIRQSRFLSTGSVQSEDDETVWWIPLRIKTGTSNEGYASFNSMSEKEVNLTELDNDFYKLNADQTAFVRVSYPPQRLEKLAEAARHGGLLSTSDRVGLVTDATALAKSGDGTTVGLLALLEGLQNEDAGVVWDAVASAFAELSAAWIEQDKLTLSALKKLAISIMLPTLHRLGYGFSTEDTLVTIQLKSLLFASAGLAGQGMIVAEAKRQLSEFGAGKREAIHPNAQRGVFSIALANNGTREQFDIVLNEFLNPKTADSKENALASLSKIEEPELVDELLGMLLTKVTVQDVHILGSGLASNSSAQWKLWEWIKSHWDEIYAKWGGNMVVLVRLCFSSYFTNTLGSLCACMS